MKRLITILAAGMAAMNLFAMNDDGHKLTGLWEKYQEARKADKPKTEAEILSQIKAQAQKERLSVDFYDAATEYVNAVGRRNWKEREPARKALEEEIKAYNEPMVTFTWMDQYAYKSTEELKEFAAKNNFGEGRNEPFYRGVGSFLGGTLPHFIKDDAQYVLWRLVAKDHEDKEIIGKLKENLDYPGMPALEYYLAVYIQSREEREKTMQELAAKYAGTAAGLFPEASVLSARFSHIREERPATDAPYKALLKDCQAFEKKRAAFKGDEAIIAKEVKSVESLIKNLQGKNLEIAFDKGNLVILFRNLTTAKVSLYQEDAKLPMNTWDAKNAEGSFYKQDTVKIKLPTLKDGNYHAEVVNGKIQGYNTYEQFTLSIASKRDARGLAVYVADYKSGKPLNSAKIYLKKGSSVVASASMSLSGFTQLPSSVTRHMNARTSYTVYAESGNRKSQEIWVDSREESWDNNWDDARCNIYKDRGAYNPGDELQFKAVLYNGDPMKKLQALEGRKVSVILRDSEGNELQKESLKTNKYGSVSGKFTIPKGLRNGHFSLEVREGKNSLAWDSFRVDEFVLPTFEIILDRNDRLFVEGDDVPVTGSVKSYSGHNLTGARAVLSVDGKELEELPIGPDNRFSFSIPAVKGGYHGATVKVIDATGETMERSTWFYIGNELSIGMSVKNAARGEFTLKDEAPVRRWVWRPRQQKEIVTENVLRLSFQVRDGHGNDVPVPVKYKLEGVASGTAASGEDLEIALSAVPAGVYKLEVSAEERGAKGSAQMKILVLRPEDKEVPDGVKYVFLYGDETVSGPVKARFGSGLGTAYAQLALYGDKQAILLEKALTAKGLADISLDYKASYPDAVRLQLFWFIEGEAVSLEQQYRREKTKLTLPLTFTRFTDAAYPGTEYTFTLKTAAGVEALAAVWDKSIDAIAGNWWPTVSLADFSVPSVSINSICGKVSGGGMFDGGDELMLEETVVMAYGSSKSASMSLKVRGMAPAMNDSVAMEADVEAEESGASSDEADVTIRSEFENALTFQPHLVSAADGTLSFSFKTSDKLSTYYVRVYAHNAAMQNAIEEKEMVVSLPVKVSLLEPRFLYEGDTYVATVTVSSIAPEPVSGVVHLDVVLPDGTVRRLVSPAPVTIPAGEVVTVPFTVEVPDSSVLQDRSSVIQGTSSVILSASEESIALTASFVAPDFSDAVRVTVPVYPARQTLTEAHSAVLRAGMSEGILLDELRDRFVNVPGSKASLKTITVLDMVRDAIPSHVEPSGKDVLSLSEAWYVRCIASVILSGSEESNNDDLLKQIMACCNSDGGFAWFEGMKSSPIITAVMLERFAKLKARGVEVPEASASVRYLDGVQFGTSRPVWCGWLSDAQYMHVRAMYPEVAFEVKPVTSADKKRMTEFKKWAKDYLTPSKKDGRGLEGRILAKARRLMTLRALAGSSEGMALAKAWGITLSSKLQKSIKADVESLLEYAVEHRDGGWYYPNAVMPWRGLLESEAYAHALLSNLLSSVIQGTSSVILSPDQKGRTEESPSAVADGIRLWLMLQKETQKWDADPAFVDAIDAILHGSQEVLDTKVLVLSATYEAPFQDIKAAGNGFTIERKFFLNGAEIAPGAEISVGDKITVLYNIWNAENRSFVKLDAGREAALQPVRQLSGLSGWSMYRNVKAERTEYFWETCPEEGIKLEEEFYVTRAGRFTAPVLVIESLYAPHYRANSAYQAPLAVITD